jgi:hypothetical protein
MTQVLLTAAARLEANSLLDRLLDEEGSTFLAEDAKRLFDLLPVTPKEPMFQVFGRFTLPWSREAPQTAGGAGRPDEGEDNVTEFKINDPDKGVLRIGGYKVRRLKHSIAITLMWNETQELEDMRDAELFFDDSGEPIRLDLYSSAVMRLNFGRFGSIGFAVPKGQQWKTPRTASATGGV